jgi:hypothetical protein
MSSQFLLVLAQATTSTTEEAVQRIVGDHPGNLGVFGAAAALLVVILLAGLAVRRRASAPADRR